MTPTRLRTLLLLALAAALLGLLLCVTSYGDLPRLPVYTPVTAALLGAFELGLARVVWRKVRAGRGPGVGAGARAGKAMHPLQVARAAALGKASSAGGALVAGLYAGIFGWTVSHRELAAAAGDTLVAGLTVGAGLVLATGGLLLERACRVPRVD